MVLTEFTIGSSEIALLRGSSNADNKNEAKRRAIEFARENKMTVYSALSLNSQWARLFGKLESYGLLLSQVPLVVSPLGQAVLTHVSDAHVPSSINVAMQDNGKFLITPYIKGEQSYA